LWPGLSLDFGGGEPEGLRRTMERVRATELNAKGTGTGIVGTSFHGSIDNDDGGANSTTSTGVTTESSSEVVRI